MMYLSRKKWCIAQYDKDCAASLAEACELDPFAALLLVSRGIKTPEQAHSFLEAGTAEFDPMCLPDMTRRSHASGKLWIIMSGSRSMGTTTRTV